MALSPHVRASRAAIKTTLTTYIEPYHYIPSFHTRIGIHLSSYVTLEIRKLRVVLLFHRIHRIAKMDVILSSSAIRIG